jgi:RND family efflux transporter MFP subunit
MIRRSRTALASVAALLAACSGNGGKATLPELGGAAAHGVRVARPATHLETGLARATGTVRAREEATLAAKSTGQIRRILAEVGQRVKAGQALVEMDAVNATIARDNARAAERLAAATLSAAEKELARSRVLHEQGALPDAGWDKAQTAHDLASAQLDQARAALRAAQQAVADATLVAPFAGVVTAKFHNSGDTVTVMPVSPILTLTDLEHLEVRLGLPEAIEGFVKPGQKVSGVTTPGGQRFEARVRVKGSVVDPSTRTIEVLADVTPGPGLKPGTLANVDFGGFADRAGLFLPASAVRTGSGGAAVLVVVGGKAQLRAVDAAPVNPGTWAVRAGLDPSADVILDPGSLAAGDAVVGVAE